MIKRSIKIDNMGSVYGCKLRPKSLGLRDRFKFLLTIESLSLSDAKTMMTYSVASHFPMPANWVRVETFREDDQK